MKETSSLKMLSLPYGMLLFLYGIISLQTIAIAETCEDVHEGCGYISKRGLCEKRESIMKRTCPKSCDMCQDEVIEERDIDNFAKEIDNDLDSCQDKMKGCEMMKSRKMCGRDIMAVKCRKTCNYCGPNCQDKQKACPKMRKLNFCTKKKPLMEKLCQSTCGLCTAEASVPAAIMSNIVVAKPKGGNCKNKYPDARCKYYSHLGWCDRNSEIRDNCQESCVCNQKTPVKPIFVGPCKESTFGCCWDNKSTKHNEKGDNCPECKDDPRFGVLCGRFGSDCDGNGQLAVSLNKYCHSTCGKC